MERSQGFIVVRMSLAVRRGDGFGEFLLEEMAAYQFEGMLA